MFYVCTKRQDGSFGVIDTNDGVTEFYKPKQLAKIVMNGIPINGVSLNPANGSFRVSVVKPSEFINNGQSSFYNTSGDIDWHAYYENLSEIEVSLKLKPLEGMLNNIVSQLLGPNFYRPLSLIDGFDCIGIENIATGIKDYKFSIFVNPDLDERGINANGFGMDLEGSEFTDDLWERHFESTFGDFRENFKKYKYRKAFPLGAKN